MKAIRTIAVIYARTNDGPPKQWPFLPLPSSLFSETLIKLIQRTNKKNNNPVKEFSSLPAASTSHSSPDSGRSIFAVPFALSTSQIKYRACFVFFPTKVQVEAPISGIFL